MLEPPYVILLDDALVTPTGGDRGRELGEWLASPANVQAFGTGDDRAAFAGAFAANRDVYAPSDTYTLATDYVVSSGDGSFRMGATSVLNGPGKLELTGLMPNLASTSFGLDVERRTWGNGGEPAIVGAWFQFLRTADVYSGRAVAVTGMGRGLAANATGWGSNFIGLAAVDDATGIGIEVNPIALTSAALAYGIIISASGSFPSQAAYQIQGNNPGATFIDGFVVDNGDQNMVTGTVLKDTGGQSQRFIYATGTFSVAELEVPQLIINATPGTLNARARLDGGNTTVSFGARGTGLTPAANSDFILYSLGNGAVKLRSGDNTIKIAADNTGITFFGGTTTAKQTISGSRGGNAALADLLTKLAAYGLIIDSTTA